MFAALTAAMTIYVISAIAAGGKMSIKRIDDPVQIQGKDMKTMSGKPIQKMRLFVYKNGKFEPVAYQIDERFANGDWVFPVGDKPEKDTDSGALDDNDELVFMAKDAGDEAPDGAKPEGAKDGVKISLRDPADNGTGFAYLFVFDNPPAPSKVDYATYKIENDWMWMIGTTYKIGTGVNESYFDKCMLKQANGSWGPEIMDRYKTRGKGISVPGMSEVPESKAQAKAIGWIDGPVRVIRKSIGYLKVALNIKFHGEGSSQNLYYASFFVVPLKLQIPAVPKALLSNFHMVLSLDFTKNFYGGKYYDAINTAGMPVDGKMSEDEKKLDLKKNRFGFCVTGPKGSVLLRYVYPKVMLDGIRFEGYYMDNAAVADPPEEEAGQSNFGIVMRDIGKLPPGNYSYDGYFCFPQNFDWAQRDRINNLIDKPILKKIDAI